MLKTLWHTFWHTFWHVVGSCVPAIASIVASTVIVVSLQGELTSSAGPAVSQVTTRPYRTLADVPRGAWFRDTWRDDCQAIRGRTWAKVVAVRQGTGTQWCQDLLILGDGTVVTPAELSATHVFTRDPFPTAPVEWPCLVGAELSEEL